MVRLRLKEVLAARKISQSKLSRLADVSLNTIQVMCHDPYHDTLISTLERLARALNVEISDLYEIVPDKEQI
jgi:DNA-binding Xre family transcriptional regulator